MPLRPDPDARPDAAAPARFRVDAPDGYENWQDYAFSDARELEDGQAPRDK